MTSLGIVLGVIIIAALVLATVHSFLRRKDIAKFAIKYEFPLKFHIEVERTPDTGGKSKHKFLSRGAKGDRAA